MRMLLLRMALLAPLTTHAWDLVEPPEPLPASDPIAQHPLGWIGTGWETRPSQGGGPQPQFGTPKFLCYIWGAAHWAQPAGICDGIDRSNTEPGAIEEEDVWDLYIYRFAKHWYAVSWSPWGPGKPPSEVTILVYNPHARSIHTTLWWQRPWTAADGRRESANAIGLLEESVFWPVADEQQLTDILAFFSGFPVEQ